MQINWLVRIKNKNFWLSMIPLLILLAQLVAGLFGATIDLGEVGNKILGIVDVVFAILALLGIVNDPTTEGTSDSRQALNYTEPKARWK